MVSQLFVSSCPPIRTSTLALLDLPPELLLAIFGLLPVPDLLRCHSVCRIINVLLSTSTEIQLSIGLYYHSQRTNDLSSYPQSSIKDNLSLLSTVNDNWANLNFVHHSTLPYPFPSSYVYELSGGRLVLGSGDDSDGRNGTTGLNFFDLPAREHMDDGKGIPQRRLIMDFPIADFAMDVTQNLLILLERTTDFGINVHIRTFDTNIPHPDAKMALLYMPNQKWVTVHISGPILACLFADSGLDVLVVWDWRTGEIIGTIIGSKMRSFVLLSADSIGIANLNQESLDVYIISIEAKSITLLQRLLLPSVMGDEDDRPWTYDSALLRSHPNPQHPLQPQSSNSISQQAHLPFITDESDGIIACTFHSASALSSFTLITHRSSLLRIYNKDEPSGETIQNGIPWSDWGPEHVRWIDVECSMRWICYVHGHRLAVLEQRPKINNGRSELTSDEEEKNTRRRLWPLVKRRLARRLGRQSDDEVELLPEEEEYLSVRDPQAFYALRVFDFNPNHVRKAEIDEITEGLPGTLLMKRVGRGNLMVKEPTIAKGKVQTRLPYLDTTVKLRKIGLGDRGRRIEGVMMNGECIVIMMADRLSRTDGVETVYLIAPSDDPIHTGLVRANHDLVVFSMDLLQHSIHIIADLIHTGLTPLPALTRHGLPYSILDLACSLRLALVMRQIRELERRKAEIAQRKLIAENSPIAARPLEEPYVIKDFVTICTVICGGEAVCSPWLQITPSFLTTPAYPLLFIGAQAFINILPSVPVMSIHTELPFSFVDALTRAFLLTTVNHGLILKNASSAISKSPWALCLVSLVLANAGFFFVNLLQMLSPYGWHVKTPPEFSPGGWRTMDLWIAPLITGTYAILTHAQPAWVPYHTHLVRRIGDKATLFGSEHVMDNDGGIGRRVSINPMGETEARAICALLLVIIFAYRAVVNFGIDWTKSSASRGVRHKRVVRSRYDGKRISRDSLKISHNHRSG